jgi:DNA polymerase-3 subunit delta'
LSTADGVDGFFPEQGETRNLISEESKIREAISSGKSWRELESALRRGIVPQSVVFFAPMVFHVPFIGLYAETLFDLADEARAYPRRRWNGENHPDLLLLGFPETPPGIDDCRSLLADLSSRPVCAPYRLAVVHCADRLSPPAANSLLKITEEPPPRGRILFLLEEENLLPTLRSRSWILRMPLEEIAGPVPPPGSDEEWIRWLRNTGSEKAEAVLLNALGWARWYALHGDFRKAADLDSLVTLSQKTRLSNSMIADLLFLMTREDVSLEDFFDPLR